MRAYFLAMEKAAQEIEERLHAAMHLLGGDITSEVWEPWLIDDVLALAETAKTLNKKYGVQVTVQAKLVGKKRGPKTKLSSDEERRLAARAEAEGTHLTALAETHGITVRTLRNIRKRVANLKKT